MVHFQFKREFTFEQRKDEAYNVRLRYPDRLPVIVERLPGSNSALMNTRKLLVPKEFTSSCLLIILRKRLQMDVDAALYLFVNGIIVSNRDTIETIYKEHHDEDGFLYLSYGMERAFG